MSYLRSLMTPTKPYLSSPDDPAAAAAPAAPAPAAAAAAPAPAAAAAAPAPTADPAAAAAAPVAGAAAPAADVGTLATGAAPAPAAAAAAAVVADWPADWREKMAGTDTGFLNTLKRYAAPGDLANWVRGMQLKISTGELKPKSEAPGKDAAPEAVAAWRKEQGLPEKPEDFLANLKLTDGIVPGEADKPLLTSVSKMAFERGYDQKAVNDFVGLYYDIQESIIAQRPQLDIDNRAAAMQQLVKEWGAEYNQNQNALKVFWADKPPEVRDTILTARTPDGRLLGDLPIVASFVASLSRELNPAAAVLPAGSGTDGKAVATRKSEIEGMMYKDGKANPAYWGNETLQAEYRTLIDAELARGARSAA